MLGLHPRLLLDATINDQNQIEGTINNVLDLVEGTTAGVASKADSIGSTLGTIIQIILFILVLALVLALFPKVWKGLMGWVSAIKMPRS